MSATTVINSLRRASEDVSALERAGLGTDGEAQYVNGLATMRLLEAHGHLDPFRFVSSQPGTRVESEGRGWECPVCASLAGLASDVRSRAS